MHSSSHCSDGVSGMYVCIRMHILLASLTYTCMHAVVLYSLSVSYSLFNIVTPPLYIDLFMFLLVVILLLVFMSTDTLSVSIVVVQASLYVCMLVVVAYSPSPLYQ